MCLNHGNNKHQIECFHPEENENSDIGALERFQASLEYSNDKSINEYPSECIPLQLVNDDWEDLLTSSPEVNEVDQTEISRVLVQEPRDQICNSNWIDTIPYDESVEYKSPQYIANGLTSFINQTSENHQIDKDVEMMDAFLVESDAKNFSNSWVQPKQEDESLYGSPMEESLENSEVEPTEKVSSGSQLEIVEEASKVTQEELCEGSSDTSLMENNNMSNNHHIHSSVEVSNNTAMNELFEQRGEYSQEPYIRQTRSKTNTRCKITRPYSAPESMTNHKVRAGADSPPDRTYNRSKPGRKPKMLPSLTYEEKVFRKLRHRVDPKFSGIVSVGISNTSCMSVVIAIVDHPILNIQRIEQIDLINTSVNGKPRIDKKYRTALPHVPLYKERTMYSRDLTPIVSAVSNIQYYVNRDFGPHAPYIPQWTRYEVDEYGEKKSSSRAALCPYCKETKFYDYGASGFLSHLGTEHGVYSTGYLVPEGLNYGEYATRSDGKKTEVEIESVGEDKKKLKPIDFFRGIQCPQCHRVIRVGCQTGKKELLNYIRHYKTIHKPNPHELITNQFWPIRKPTRAHDGDYVGGWHERES